MTDASRVCYLISRQYSVGSRVLSSAESPAGFSGISNIELLAELFFPASIRYLRDSFDGLQKEINKLKKYLKTKKINNAFVIKNFENIISKKDKLARSQMPLVLETSLFNSLFSAFDAFQGDMLSSLYTKRPNLFCKLNRTISISEIINYKSFNEIKTRALQEEIEQFRRKSYVEQFEDLEKTFGLKLKEFEHWPQFVECSQRRNILTHCDGVVSKQYLKICKENGYQFSSPIKVGDRLSVDNQYFFSSCELLAEVAFKLCHTLWRKVLEDELSEADKYLNRTIYDLLLSENWKRAQIFGEFAVKLPRFSSDVEKKISTMNYVMSLKFGGKKEKSKEILNATDWSSSSYDFKIANAILSDDFNGAAKLMIAMGAEGELIDENVYYIWPLFFEFRQSDIFIKTFKHIYKRPFIVGFQRKAQD